MLPPRASVSLQNAELGLCQGHTLGASAPGGSQGAAGQGEAELCPHHFPPTSCDSVHGPGSTPPCSFGPQPCPQMSYSAHDFHSCFASTLTLPLDVSLLLSEASRTPTPACSSILWSLWPGLADKQLCRFPARPREKQR